MENLQPLLDLICELRKGEGRVTSRALVWAAVDAIGAVIWCSMLQVLPAEGGADGDRWPVPVR